MTTSADQSLRQRAQRVIPNGMWGHMNAARIAADYPQYFAKAQGCRLWDVDGREYIDFMCSYGPMILGYGDPDVERAAARQRAEGDIFNGPSARLVELAELMTDTVNHADWAMFQKNGTDATTASAMIAREGTGRRKILLANGAYHGAVPWCNPYPAGSTVEDRAHNGRYEYNDSASLEAAAEACRGDLAGIFVSAFKHDIGKPHEMPTRGFAETARRICDQTGAALIVDDVRAGFRLHIGGSWELTGVKPDLSAWSKAIANGYPLACVTGNDRFREAAGRIFVTGSFWYGAIAMAAAIATITRMKDIGAIAIMERMGQRLRDGIAMQAKQHGLVLRQSGPVQMPVMLFDDDAERRKGWLFCAEALKRGVYLHATHTMFLSAAHTEADIDRALEATGQAMAVVAQSS